jgi:hypothetical protein
LTKLFIQSPQTKPPKSWADYEAQALMAEADRLFTHFLCTGEIKPTNQEIIDQFLGQAGILSIISDEELTPEIIKEITQVL